MFQHRLPEEPTLPAVTKGRHADAYQCILALVGRGLRNTDQSTLAQSLRRIDLQIRALALLTLQTEAEIGAGGGFWCCASQYIRALSEQLEISCLKDRGIARHLSLPKYMLRPEDQCRNLGLILIDLVVQFSTCDFSGVRTPAIDVILCAASGEATRLVAASNGQTDPGWPSATVGGMDFVRTLARSMGASWTVEGDAAGSFFDLVVAESPRPVSAGFS